MASSVSRLSGRAWWPDVLLVLLVGVVFGRAVLFGFVDWDDLQQVVENRLTHHPLAFGWRALLTTPGMGYAQPLTLLSQHVELRLGGGAPWLFHLDNILLHAGNAVLVRRILQRYALYPLVPLLGAALFAVHPLMAEPVCWVTGRKDVLAGLFVLGGFLLYLRAGRWAGAGVVLGTLLACACKPTGVVLPLLALADAVLLRRSVARSLQAGLALSVVLAAALAVLAYLSQQRDGAIVAGVSLAERLRYASEHLAFQLRNYVLPDRLLPKYLDEVPRPLLSPLGMGSVVLLLGAGVLAWRGGRLAMLALAWFALTFAPSSGFITLNRGPADTYLYLPSVALAAGLAAGLCGLRRYMRWPPQRLALPLVAVLGFATFAQTELWRCSSSLWRPVYEAYPDHTFGYQAYASALLLERRPREARAVLDAAMRRFPYPPPYPILFVTLGAACAASGDDAAALRAYGEAVRHFPPDAGRALRLLGAAARRPDAAYAPEVAVARGAALAALRELAQVPGGERLRRLQTFFARQVDDDPAALRGLQVLGSAGDAQDVHAVVSALLGMARP